MRITFYVVLVASKEKMMSKPCAQLNVNVIIIRKLINVNKYLFCSNNNFQLLEIVMKTNYQYLRRALSFNTRVRTCGIAFRPNQRIVFY